MATPTASPPPPSMSEWTPMHFHVRTYLAGHPLLHGFEVHTEAGGDGVTAELRYHSRSLASRHTASGWWKPCSPDRGRQIADVLARDLHTQWMALLKRR